ncbi:MAG: ester cyclase [Thaumarchaeota archaeon]|nr:ester cyclase [Nitrososphaerota archaeon]
MTSILQTKLVVESYLHGHDSSKIADDAVFVVMGTGQESKGQVAISQLLDYFYNKAFSARFDQKDLVVGEGKAVAEGDFVGKQNIEFAGIQPSGKEVHIPLLIKYDVKNGKITRANIYFETDALRM